MPIKLDNIDQRILNLLQNDATLNNLELADKIGLSATPCARRIARLKRLGIIEKKVTLLSREKLNLGLCVMVSISLDTHTPERLEGFSTAIQQFEEIIECNLVTGQSYDFLLKALVPNMTHFETLLLNKITRIQGVTGVRSSFVLREIINRTQLPLSHIQ